MNEELKTINISFWTVLTFFKIANGFSRKNERTTTEEKLQCKIWVWTIRHLSVSWRARNFTTINRRSLVSNQNEANLIWMERARRTILAMFLWQKNEHGNSLFRQPVTYIIQQKVRINKQVPLLESNQIITLILNIKVWWIKD